MLNLQRNLFYHFLIIILMDIFYEETDGRRCVPFNSCHPKQCKNGIPFSLPTRISTIVETAKLEKNT